MKNQFVTYQIAKAFKDAGFDEECFALYNPNLHIQYGIKNTEIDNITDNKNIICAAPLWQQCIDWLREKHNILANSIIEIKGVYHWIVAWSVSEYEVETCDVSEDSWYNAREAAILKALEIITKKL